MTENTSEEVLYAPWRIPYIRRASRDEQEGCFLCEARDADDPVPHLVLARGAQAFVLMNRYPYHPGHLMIATHAHQGEVEEVGEEAAREAWRWLVVCKAVLAEVMHPRGFNIGINQGRCAGAGVVDHFHMHIVPRWSGDNNFMPVLANTRVFSQALKELYADLHAAFDAHEGPGRRGRP